MTALRLAALLLLLSACRRGFVEPEADLDLDGVSAADDCDDTDATVFPGADETCDGRDEDCDGLVDEDAIDRLTFYADADADGFGDEDAPVLACALPDGLAAEAGDCDDADATRYPGAPEPDCTDPVDRDCDGFAPYEDADQDGFAACEDCDDDDPAVFPGADETCDGRDEDCDGLVDEDPSDAPTWYADLDGDGFGDPEAAVAACARPADSAANDLDCDDADPRAHPNGVELCDGVDQDCDGLADADAVDAPTWFPDGDGDGVGGAGPGLRACEEPEDHALSTGDCDDADPAVFPGAVELCNGVDDNCRGGVDEGFDLDRDGVTTCAGDCDDADPLTRPGALEVCNGEDDDCDDAIDEGAVDARRWFADADGDGIGGPDGEVVLACARPAAHGPTADDCDDADPTVFPGAPETCDGRDEDCDEAVDEGFDLDRDGVTSCAGDCDDTDRLIRPGAAELCDGVDNDCDEDVDDADEDVIGAGIYYADADGDRFGDDATAARRCARPDGWLAVGGDCDDADRLVNPARDELCNGVDDDCDGDVDEEPVDAELFWPDLDGDRFGDGAADPVAACERPRRHVRNDADCLDSDALVYPGAPERDNGLDDDCNGLVDDGLWFGTGADGDLAVSGRVDLSRFASAGRTAPDGVAYGVRGLIGARVTLDAAAAGLAPGDEVLLINLHGSDARHANVGAYAFGRVAAVDGPSVTLEAAPAVLLGELDNADLVDQAVMLLRVPNYAEVRVGAAGRLTTAPWDGRTGGVLAFRARRGVRVDAGGRIDVDGLGYAGGSTGLTAGNCDAYQGESYAGEGEGEGNGVCTGGYNEAWGQWAPNYGGGGAHITGGGGNHAGGAEAGASWTGGSATPPAAGLAYGEPSLARIFPGSGGGGVWQSSYGQPDDPGPGGDGGGIVLLATSTLDLAAPGAITARGDATVHWAIGTWTYGAGGGAGGTIWVQAADVVAPVGALVATGGAGKKSGVIRPGGNGGVGRIRVDLERLGGDAAPDPAEVAALGAPAVGFSAAP